MIFGLHSGLFQLKDGSQGFHKGSGKMEQRKHVTLFSTDKIKMMKPVESGKNSKQVKDFNIGSFMILNNDGKVKVTEA